MKILIKGAGDLATGIASRLYGAGHQILMTEIAQPLTVRRTVALSRAVYDRRAIVEEMEAVSAKTQEDAEAIMEEGKIPVIVDPKADCRKWYKPDVIVDAIIAKKNTGTKITDAPFVIGIGPGFTAGKDCHCVIETKRGHTLGSVIWEGSAIADTGVPGNIGGYTTERLIRASEDGIIEPKVRIGDIVEKGQIVAVTGGKPVFAQMGGIVRGMLQPGAYVKKNLKIGDIDARAERSHCETISDKARAIGGGALEAAERFEKIKGHYAVVILAAGKGTRFSGERGESKLHAKIDQKPMYMHMMDKMQAFSSVELFIVTGDEKIIEEAEKRGIFVVRNKEPEKGIAHSVVLGLKAVSHSFKSGTDRKSGAPDGILFSVCDQPKLKISTIQRILNDAALHKKNVICAGYRGQKGNPVLWPAHCFAELLELTGDEGGRQMLTKYEEKVRIIDVAPYSPIALANVRIVPDAIPGPAVGITIFQKIFVSDMPSVRPAYTRFTSICSIAALAFRYISGNEITIAAITHPIHVCTTLKPNSSNKNAPTGLLLLNNNSKKKPATVGGITIGSVKIPSSTAFFPGEAFTAFPAANIPRKNEITVAATPVFKEIYRGLQSRFFNISVTSSIIYTPHLFAYECIISCLNLI